MKKQILQRPVMTLVGINVRTNNAAEMSGMGAKIGLTVGMYFQGGTPQKILHRKTPGVTYAVYTDYESDMQGDYTYFIGEEVTSLEGQNPSLATLEIPEQTYSVFTTPPAPLPKGVVEAWQKIWHFTAQDLGGTRAYKADFEVYDGRAQDFYNAVVDIHIGLV